MSKTKDIKEIEIEAKKRFDVNIDAENHKTRSMDASQISLLSIQPEKSDYKESEDLVKIPKFSFSAASAYPLEYLINALMLAKKSGASHATLFMKSNAPICIKWEFEAEGKPTDGNEKADRETKNFKALYYLAPRVTDETHELPPRATMLKIEEEKKEEAKPSEAV